MNIIRLILLLLLIWTIWSFFSRKKTLKIQDKPVVKQGEMVSCQHCGLHIPTEEAIKINNANFCCKEHIRL